MRKLASIRIIDDILPIENADRLEQAVIGGWRVVVAKGDFVKGAKVVFFEIDSALPADDERYAFLKERCLRKWMCSGNLVLEIIRIKSIKLRGVISQGLIMPLSAFPEVTDTEVGTDLTEILKVQHYDELADQYDRITGKVKIMGDAKGNFPTYLVPKTDEERLQNHPEYFDGRYRGVMFEVTEKYDGCSATYIYSPSTRPDDPFFVCSRNLELKDTKDNLYWDMAREYNIFDALKLIYMIFGIEAAIQGEIVGPGVNGNRDLYTEHLFYVFRIYDTVKRKWIAANTRRSCCSVCDLPHVAVIAPYMYLFNSSTTMDNLIKFAEGKTARGNEREGLVFKALDGSVSFKVINNKYLLKEK